MIGNQRQLAVAEGRLRELRQSWEATTSEVDRLSYADLIADTEREISEYRAIRDGVLREFEVSSLDEVGAATIKARLAAGLNQRQLAEELGVTEQAVQKDESAEYENAGLARLAEIMDVLGHELVGVVRPAAAGSAPAPWQSYFVSHSAQVAGLVSGGVGSMSSLTASIVTYSSDRQLSAGTRSATRRSTATSTSTLITARTSTSGD